MGFFSALCLILIVLKLTGFIALSWWTIILGPLLAWVAVITLAFVTMALLK